MNLILFCGLQGIGAGGVQATVKTLGGDLHDLSERGRVQGWLSSVWGMSAVAEYRAAEPVLPPWFWRSRALAGSAAAAFGLLVIGPTTVLPTYGQSVLGLGAGLGLLSVASIVGPLTIAGALLIMPRHFSTTAGESASTGSSRAGPGGKSE